jgi:arsenate reductase
MSDKVFNVLFLCTCNSGRSILAEALLNALGKGRFKAFSAGSFPTGVVSPYAISFLQKIDLPVDGLRSKSWAEFASPDAPVMDYVLTVCDDVAGEQCPTWLGQPIVTHWGIPDPAAVEGTKDEKSHAFMEAATHLRKRIELFVSLPTTSLDRMSIKRQLQEIGMTA